MGIKVGAHLAAPFLVLGGRSGAAATGLHPTAAAITIGVQTEPMEISMAKPTLPIPSTYMLSSAAIAHERGMDVLTLALAQGVDHLQAIQSGEHPGIVIRIVLNPRQCRDMSDLLRREVNLPDHRPN